MMHSRKIQVLSETVKKLISCDATENLKNILAKAHQADIAFVLAELPLEHQALAFSLLRDPGQKAQVLSELRREQATPLLEHLGAKPAAEILEFVSPDDLADILEALPDPLSQEILIHLKKEEALEVENLISYPPETAGGIMSPNVFALNEDLTVKKSIQQIQKSRKVETVFYVYVVNEQQHLVGVLSLKKLILAPPEALLKEVMDKDPIRVRLNEDQEEVARTVSRYNYLSLPVVDDSNHLVGVITVDDVIDVIQEEAAEDMLLMAGVNPEAPHDVSLKAGLLKRLPWFLVTLVSGFAAAEIIAAYFSSQNNFYLLAGFIPLILGMGSGIGTQSMTVVISTFSMERTSLFQMWPLIFKELRLATLIGVTCGFFFAFYFYFRFDAAWWFAYAIGFALASTMVLAVMIGLAIPLLFKKVGVDPAGAARTFVTAGIQIFCLWVYFSLTLHIISRYANH